MMALVAFLTCMAALFTFLNNPGMASFTFVTCMAALYAFSDKPPMPAKSHGLELCESETASTRRIETVRGSHRFKVEGYSYYKGIGIGNFVTSPTLTVGGYDWAILYYPDGLNEEYKDYLTFSLELKSEGTSVKAAWEFFLLTNNKRPTKISLPTLNKFDHKVSRWWGYKKFIERNKFEISEHLKVNCFKVLCVLKVIKPPCIESMQSVPVRVSPSNLDQQFHYLLKSGNAVDVTFEVGREFFKAHKLILGARSQVFNALFFSQLKETQTDHIKLDNTEVEVFRVFIDFLYSDSVSKLEETTNGHDREEAVIMYQYLLVAADCYDIERLKLICENELSHKIEAQNLATTLTLEEQHNCPHVKTSCFKFMASNNLAATMRTKEFEHLMRSCPYILKELVEFCK